MDPNSVQLVVNLLRQASNMLSETGVNAGLTNSSQIRTNNMLGIVGSSGGSFTTPVSSTSSPITVRTNNTASSSTSVLAELRSSFQPYDRRHSIRASRAAPSSSRSRQAIRPRVWNQKIFCLSGPTDIVTPTGVMKAKLQTGDLGVAALQIDQGATQAELVEAIKELYPKLAECELELLRSFNGGEGKPLVRISPSDPVPTISYLMTAMNRTIIYVRPNRQIFETLLSAATDPMP